MRRKDINEDYRGHRIVVREQAGKYRGRVYNERNIEFDHEGASSSSVEERLRSYIDQKFEKLSTTRKQPPSGEEYVAAFKKILPRMHDGHLAMLKAHYHADDQLITATQLADAASYSGMGAANLHYGTLGSLLHEQIPMDLPKYRDGRPVTTFALATAGNQEGDEGSWQWKLRPEVAYAIERLGLDA